MRFDAVQAIKNRLTMREVMERYGYMPDKKGFVCCPFHKEKTPSMKVFDKDFHCFGCAEHGDVISFVQKIFDLSFSDALKKIDLDFNLNIYGAHSFEEMRQSQRAEQYLQAKKQRELQERKKAERQYQEALFKLKRLEKNMHLFEPLSATEEYHPLFVEAAQNISIAEYIFEQAERRLL